IEIKSRMLLPVRPSAAGGGPEAPRAVLGRRLLEYERMELAARQLDELPRVGRDFLVAHATADFEVARLLPEVSPDDLRDAWAAIMHRARLNASHHISREQLSVRDHMSHILRRLSDVRFMEFTELLLERVRMGEPAAVLVMHFLALLELARESLLEITQAAPYAPLYVRLSYTRSA